MNWDEIADLEPGDLLWHNGYKIKADGTAVDKWHATIVVDIQKSECPYVHPDCGDPIYILTLYLHWPGGGVGRTEFREKPEKNGGDFPVWSADVPGEEEHADA